MSLCVPIVVVCWVGDLWSVSLCVPIVVVCWVGDLWSVSVCVPIVVVCLVGVTVCTYCSRVLGR